MVKQDDRDQGVELNQPDEIYSSLQSTCRMDWDRATRTARSPDAPIHLAHSDRPKWRSTMESSLGRRSCGERWPVIGIDCERPGRLSASGPACRGTGLRSGRHRSSPQSSGRLQGWRSGGGRCGRGTMARLPDPKVPLSEIDIPISDMASAQPMVEPELRRKGRTRRRSARPRWRRSGQDGYRSSADCVMELSMWRDLRNRIQSIALNDR